MYKIKRPPGQNFFRGPSKKELCKKKIVNSKVRIVKRFLFENRQYNL